LYLETWLFVLLRCKREEAKITAWENLQKAKAEAAIRKLEVLFVVHMCSFKCFDPSHWSTFLLCEINLHIESSIFQMKLEKKRSSSMDRILGKLRSAQKKAHDMRSVVSYSEDHCGARTTKKTSFLVKTGKPFSCCFTYRAC
jgi:hypothetical protein